MRVTTGTMTALAALAVASGCAGEDGAPGGTKGGTIGYDCSAGCGDDLARERLAFTEIWCEWEGDRVLVHVRIENPLVVPAKSWITPAYEIRDGGRHGTSFGSDRVVPTNRSSYTEAAIDAGSPEGVPTGSEISLCEPQVQRLETVDEVDVVDATDVEILAQGPLG